MKSFKQLTEALNLNQKEKLGINFKPSSNAADKLSKDIIPEGQLYHHIPLAHDTKAAIADHLSSHGYKLDDYAKGLAKDKHGRSVNIGKVLRSKDAAASPDLVKGFENDDRKSNTITPESHHILLSKSSEHVGECSTNKGWKSCARLTPTGKYAGEAAKKLKHMISAGSHVAYLMPKDTDNVEKADARVLLHPYNAHDSDGKISHSVLRREEKTYSKTGGLHSGFTKSIDDYLEKHHPMQPGKVYHKSPWVYDDDKRNAKANTSPESIVHIASSPTVNRSDRSQLFKNIQLHPDTISKLLDMKHDGNPSSLEDTHGLIAAHQKLSDTHVDKLLKRFNYDKLSDNENLTKDQVSKFIRHTPDTTQTKDPKVAELLRDVGESSLDDAHSKLLHSYGHKMSSDDISHLIHSNRPQTISTIPKLQSPVVTPKHIHAYMNRPIKDTDNATKHNNNNLSMLYTYPKHFSTEQVHSIVNNPHTDATDLSNIAKFSPSAHDAILQHPKVKDAIASHTRDYINKYKADHL